jgi:hypothetical protein
MTTITSGMQKALGKLPGSGYECPECGLLVPKYTGRYPGKCSNCGTELLKNEEYKMSRAESLINNLELFEKKGKKIKVPKFKTDNDAFTFVKNLGLDNTPVSDVILPDTGEVIMEPGDTKRNKLKSQAKSNLYDDDLWDLIVGSFKNPKHWIDLYDNDFRDFYHIVEKSIKDMVDDPDKLEKGDYDIYMSIPAAISRKDGKPFTQTDVENIDTYTKFVETTSIKVWFLGKKGAKRGTFEPIFA